MDWHIAGPLFFDGVKGYFVTTSFMARPQSSYLNEIIIPKGRMADDAALAAKRAELKRKLLEGGKITLKNFCVSVRPKSNAASSTDLSRFVIISPLI